MKKIMLLFLFVFQLSFASSPLHIQKTNFNDLSNLVNLAMQRHVEYQHFDHHFWHLAKNAKNLQQSYFKKLIQTKTTVSFIAYDKKQAVGMIIATPFKEPPIYNPETKSYLIDDFYVTKNCHWQSVGKALLNKVIHQLHQQHVNQIVVISADADKAKKQMLMSMPHFSSLSTWFVGHV